MLWEAAIAFVATATASVTAVVLAVLPAPALAARPAVAISPEPGTQDASPTTQISIFGAPPSQIQQVHVIGSISGKHRGAFHAYSGRRGASFVLSRPLTQGERVSVTVQIRGRAPLREGFTVAHLAPTPPTLNLPFQQPDKLQHFVSRPDLLPPKITVRRHAPGAGDIFLTPLPSPTVHPQSRNAITIHPVGPGGPMIIDGRGQLVWFDQLAPPAVAANLQIQQFGGHKVLTWWQGTVTLSAYGDGEGVIADSSYGTIKTVRAGNGYPTDLHEFLITSSSDALFTIYSPVLVHLPGTPAGKLSPLLDAIVQEVDIRTGLVVWEWHSLGHIPLRDSYATPANSADYDAFHVNSIEQEPGGRLLISARDTSAIYELDQASGRILWTLGGKASTFRMRPGARFYFQHDARMPAAGVVSLFDDGAGPPMFERSSRALILKLDTRRRTATMLRQNHRPGNDTSAQSEGSVQSLAGGNVFVGFGSTPFFSMFSAAGKLVFDASLPTDDGSYREFSFPWNATPSTRPAAAARRTSSGHVSVYASWNGATTVARWEVLAGSSTASLKTVSKVPRRGFETRIDVTTPANMFQVRALGASGRVLASS